ncbi:MAG: alpha/beta fold hydrolase [Burkholderiales bacterium]
MPRPENRFITVDGLRLRYIEEGEGPPVLFLHGAALGTSADSFLRNLAQFAAAGFRALALDLPAFGLSEHPAKQSLELQRNAIPGFIDAMGLGKTALVAHSRSGVFAAQLVLEDPKRYSHVIVLGTGPLLPPLEKTTEPGGASPKAGAANPGAISPATNGAAKEPTLEKGRRLLEADLFNVQLATEEEVALRHGHMLGRNFSAHQERQNAQDPSSGEALWQRVSEIKIPWLMIYGRQDRANAGERAERLKSLRPELKLHIADGCKHLVHWDAAELLLQLGVPFLKG